MTSPLLIATPQAEEARGILRRLRRTERDRSNPDAAWLTQALLAGRPVGVAIVGDGAAPAASGLRRAVEARSWSAVVIAGVAGGLDPELRPMDMIVCESVVGPDGRSRFSDRSGVDHLGVPTGSVPRGIAVETPMIAADPDAKRDLFRRFGGPGAVVDLESATAADVADDLGLPWVVVRAVSDAAHETLPASIPAAQVAGGGVSRGRVVTATLLRPWTVPTLLRLARRVHRCADRLADAVERLAADWHP